MRYKVETLDGRHTDNHIWKYRLYVLQDQLYQYSHQRYRYFHILRTWMIEQYGPSCERDSYMKTVAAYKEPETFESVWCWHIDREKDYLYIYVKTDEVLAHLQLKWAT
jgi:hypothetical protein